MADSLNKKKGNRAEGEDMPAGRNESVSVADIEKLFSLMHENEIAELEIEQHKTKIHIVSKAAPQTAQAQPMVQYMPGMQPYPMMPMGGQQGPGGQADPPPPPPQSNESSTSAPAARGGAESASDSSALPPNAKTVLSPMVGTFYRSPSPEAAAFVKEGDVVNEETVLCIIEAMKLMNEIKAEARGKIIKILVENGMPVEFNQPLFVLEP